ncbi:Ppx/GppA family phosphatase [Novosphingobium sp.]|uniref:Ppx/GppA family phosphatase n=1 Tax=Novosphingobium sp. TaxID=1874826 RepID=UPI00261B7786|nr:Ppx/GppA family phosphatase [Novosphingobium sp.]
MPRFTRTSAYVPTRAIIDIGSNTVRLVIYGGPARAPDVLHNEKVTARLGKGVADNGKLGQRAMGAALASLARYRTLLDLKGITEVDVVATAAARDAVNGGQFLDQIRALGLSPRLLSGEEEAITSAHGVMGAFPGAHGVVGDLGGGSLELVDVDADGCRHGTSLPLGTLRLPGLRAGGERAFGQNIARMLKRADWRAAPGSTLHLVGGSLRAFARHAMTMSGWPIDDPHGFEIAAPQAQALAKALGKRKPETLLPVPGLSSARLAALPDTAALLFVLIRALQPGRLVFSSWGLREGVLWDRMAPAVRMQDPLVAGAAAFATDYGISAGTGAMVTGWTAAARLPDAASGTEHLRLTATMLCLATAMVEPNLRGDLAREWALRKRWIGASPADRAMLAAAMIANTGRSDLPADLGLLASPEQLREAQAWGLATRLCRRFSGNTAQGISGSALRVEGSALVLAVQPQIAVLVNEGVERDLKTLAAHLGLKAQVR